MNAYKTAMINVIASVLNGEGWDTHAARHTMLKSVRYYYEHLSDGTISYQPIERRKRYHKWTKRAFKNLEEGLLSSLAFEHLVPCGEIVNQLLNLRRNRDVSNAKIQFILEQSEAIITTKEEANALNGSPMKNYTLEKSTIMGAGLKNTGTKLQRLSAIGAEIDDRSATNSTSISEKDQCNSNN